MGSARSSLCAATFLAPSGSSRRRWTPRRCAPSFSLLAQLASQQSSLACGDRRCGVLLRSMQEFVVLRLSVDSDSDLILHILTLSSCRLNELQEILSLKYLRETTPLKAFKHENSQNKLKTYQQSSIYLEYS